MWHIEKWPNGVINIVSATWANRPYMLPSDEPFSVYLKFGILISGNPQNTSEPYALMTNQAIPHKTMSWAQGSTSVIVVYDVYENPNDVEGFVSCGSKTSSVVFPRGYAGRNGLAEIVAMNGILSSLEVGDCFIAR
ncbi:MAG TPA: hypothetical protein VFE51_08435 [Verrucomicrobiae bacterium]|nr:hypothetical protein [Verrucomicrobiae bacterium]